MLDRRLRTSPQKGHVMKGNDKLLKTLNSLLADELTAITRAQYDKEIAPRYQYQRKDGVKSVYDALGKCAICVVFAPHDGQRIAAALNNKTGE